MNISLIFKDNKWYFVRHYLEKQGRYYDDYKRYIK